MKREQQNDDDQHETRYRRMTTSLPTTTVELAGEGEAHDYGTPDTETVTNISSQVDRTACAAYCSRVYSTTSNLPPATKPHKGTIVLNGIITFIGMLALSAIEYGVFTDWLDRSDLAMLIGSQGAAAVLVFDAFKSPLARPFNVVFGALRTCDDAVCSGKSALHLSKACFCTENLFGSMPAVPR